MSLRDVILQMLNTVWNNLMELDMIALGEHLTFKKVFLFMFVADIVISAIVHIMGGIPYEWDITNERIE